MRVVMHKTHYRKNIFINEDSATTTTQKKKIN